MDQNLRLRSVIRDELVLWRSVVNEGKALSYGEAKRHVSQLMGATEYDGRDEGPIDYREPALGGNLKKEWGRYPEDNSSRHRDNPDSLSEYRDPELGGELRPRAPWTENGRDARVKEIMGKSRKHKIEILKGEFKV